MRTKSGGGSPLVIRASIAAWLPNGAAQSFMAKTVEQHLGNKLEGQHIVARLETDLARSKTIVSFQPEVLPLQTRSFTFLWPSGSPLFVLWSTFSWRSRDHSQNTSI